jgi:hypothetical protein
MLKVGANSGASGENAIVHTSRMADIIIGPIGILIANAMLGEVTPKMAAAAAASPARKILIPLTQENIEVVGITPMPLPHIIDALLEQHLPRVL